MPIPKKLPGSGGAIGIAIGTSSAGVPSSGQDTKVLLGRYSVGRHLGSGNFGSVYLVTDMKDYDRKVLKKIKVGEIQPDETIEAVKEATLLSQLDHPAIVKFHDSFLDGEFFFILTEYCEGGDLDNMIKQVKEAGKVLDQSLVLDWFVQLTNAVRYIHDRRVLHRDLKTRNIFLKEGKIKLGDFGISRILMGTSDYATTFTGTPYYMSPEVLKQNGYNSKSDIWSLGVVLYELCTLEHAFTAENLLAVMYKIVEGIAPRLPDHFNPSLRSLFIRMLDKDPRKRPTAVEILQDHFIKQHMEGLSQKLAMKLSSSRRDPSEEAKAIARALGPLKRKESNEHLKKKQLGSDTTDGQTDRPLTPREKMLNRKSQKAEEEAEKIRLAAVQNFSENQKRYKEIKKKKSKKIVPPWVGEHPDIFDDPNFSITAIDLTTQGQGKKEKDINDSLMDLSLGSLSASTKDPSLEEMKHYEQQGIESVVMMEDNIPEDPLAAETYYSQFDDFEMDVSSGSLESDDDYQAIIHCITEALELPETKSDQILTELPNALPPKPESHDEFSPFSPLAREKRIALLKEEGKKVLGPDVFHHVYEYLKAARQKGSQVNEADVMCELRKITSNTRDCFIVDQLVFLEKQENDGY